MSQENAFRLAATAVDCVWESELDYYVSGAAHTIYHPIRLINKHGQPPTPPAQPQPQPPPPRVSPPSRIDSPESGVCNL